MAETLSPLVGVLALQGAFEEHQKCLEAAGCRTKQVRVRRLDFDLDRGLFMDYLIFFFHLLLSFLND